MKQLPINKLTFILHESLLAVGPILMLIAGLQGIGIFDGLTENKASDSAGLLTLGILSSVFLPIGVLVHSVFLATAIYKTNKKVLFLPFAYFILGASLFFGSVALNYPLSTYIDCDIHHEDNPVKCGFK